MEKFLSVKLEYIDPKEGLVQSELKLDGRKKAYDKAWEIIEKYNCKYVDVNIIFEPNGISIQGEQKRVKNKFYPELDYYLLKEGEHETVKKHSYAEAYILHNKSGIRFLVNNSDVKYTDELIHDPASVFYSFEYIDPDGKEHKFTLVSSLPGKTEEEKEEIKQTILIPGAKWYCEHFREAWCG